MKPRCCAILLLAAALPLAAQSRRTHDSDNDVAAETQQLILHLKFAEAEPLAQKLANNHADAAPLWSQLGYVEARLEKVDAALTAYRKADELEPSLETKINLANLLITRGETPEARDQAAGYLRQAAKLEPDAQQSQHIVDMWNLIAGFASTRGDHAHAVAYAKEVTQLDPRAWAWGSLADFEIAAGDDSAGEKDLRHALELDAKSKEALQSLASLQMRQGKYAEAAASIDQLLTLDPQRMETRLLHARLLNALGERQKAADEFAASIDLLPYNAQADLEYVGLLIQLNHPKEASERARKSLLLDAAFAPMQVMRGRAEARQLNYSAALDAYLAAVKLDPKSAEYLGDAALGASQDKQPQLCLRLLDARAKLAEENAATAFLRAISYDTLTDTQQAIVWYRKFLALDKGESAHVQMRFQSEHRLVAIDPSYREQYKREHK